MTISELHKITEGMMNSGKGEMEVCVKADENSYTIVKKSEVNRFAEWGYRLLEVDERSDPECGSAYLCLIGEIH